MGELSSMNMTSSTSFFHYREKQLKQEIADLTISQVKEDYQFLATEKRIKKQFLLSSASVGEPKIEGSRRQAMNYGPNFNGTSINSFLGGTTEVEVFTVKFPVTGSAEIFEYRTSGASLSSTYPIFTPEASHLRVDVFAPADKDEAFAKANEQIATTKILIEQNNPEAELWSQRISLEIDTLLAEKRKKLLDFFS